MTPMGLVARMSSFFPVSLIVLLTPVLTPVPSPGPVCPQSTAGRRYRTG